MLIHDRLKPLKRKRLQSFCHNISTTFQDSGQNAWVLLFYGFKPVLPGLSGETDKPPAMRVRVEGYTKKFPKLIE